jgi:hypothetical protein
MAVSKQYVEDLVIELNIAKVEDALDRLALKKQFDLDVANGMCAECCEWTYCLCDYYLD